MSTSTQTNTPNPVRRSESPKVLMLISILIGFTATRVLAVAFIPKLSMLGGEAPDAWLGPWVADGILGVVLPFAIVAIYRLRTVRVWGALLLYNGIGAFDYGIGLVTQWQHPLPASVAPGWLVYGSLLFTLAAQLVVIALLLRQDVVKHFLGVS